MKWFQRKIQKQTTHNELKSTEAPMLENQKIPQVITGCATGVYQPGSEL